MKILKVFLRCYFCCSF